VADNTTAATTTTSSLSKGSTVNNEESADHDATNYKEDVFRFYLNWGGYRRTSQSRSYTKQRCIFFTEDDFLESITEISNATRHRGVWHNALEEINELEGEEVVCQNQEEGKVTWKVIKECDEDLFEEIRLKEIDLLQTFYC